MVRIGDRLLITPGYIIAVEVDPVSGFYLTLNGKKIVRAAAVKPPRPDWCLTTSTQEQHS
jgi:hypothetical protein